MAINFGVEPPRWLQQDAQPARTDVASKDVGWLLGGALNSVTQDETFRQGLTEARLSMADPLWKIKQQQMETRIKGELGDIEAQHALAVQRNNESSAWLNDAPKVSTWMGLPADERATTPPPTATSEKANKMIEAVQIADQRAAIAKDANDTRLQGVLNQTTSAKIAVEDAKRFNQRIALVDPAERARIKAMKPNQDGSPSAEAWSALSVAEQAAQAAADQKAKEAAAAGQTVTQTTKTAAGSVTTKSTPATSSEPKMGTLPNGQVYVYMQGGKGIHILADPKKAVEGKVVFEELRDAEKALTKAQTTIKDEDILLPLRTAVTKAKIAFRDYWKETSTPPPAGASGQKIGRFIVSPAQ